MSKVAKRKETAHRKDMASKSQPEKKLQAFKARQDDFLTEALMESFPASELVSSLRFTS